MYVKVSKGTFFFLIQLHFLLPDSQGCPQVSKEMPPTQLLFKQEMGRALEAILKYDSCSPFLLYPPLLSFYCVFPKRRKGISIKCKMSTLNNDENFLERQSLLCLTRMPCARTSSSFSALNKIHSLQLDRHVLLSALHIHICQHKAIYSCQLSMFCHVNVLKGLLQSQKIYQGLISFSFAQAENEVCRILEEHEKIKRNIFTCSL